MSFMPPCSWLQSGAGSGVGVVFFTALRQRHSLVDPPKVPWIWTRRRYRRSRCKEAVEKLFSQLLRHQYIVFTEKRGYFLSHLFSHWLNALATLTAREVQGVLETSVEAVVGCHRRGWKRMT